MELTESPTSEKAGHEVGLHLTLEKLRAVGIEARLATGPLPSASGAAREVGGIVAPGSAEEVVTVVQTARRMAVPVYPVSRGRNWGYGTNLPVRSGGLLVDLSRMNRIVEFDEELGVVCIEPGVAQQDLYDYLQRHRLQFRVPVHGGGPDCSLLGNALERGYGITPISDHFAGLTSLEAVLPDGTVYRSALSELGGARVSSAFKWGVGPYVDGLFSQGNFGIVTQGTLALSRQPERVEAVIFQVPDDSLLEPVVAAMRELSHELGSVLAPSNLMNDLRVLSMSIPYPHADVEPGGTMSAELVGGLARKWNVSPWTGVTALEGPGELVRAARAIVRRTLRGLVSKLVFCTEGRLARLQRLVKWMPSGFRRRVDVQLRGAAALLDVFRGRPTRVALPLAYWRSGNANTDMEDPTRDGCGLRWYAPLVPFDPASVRSFVEMVRTTCPENGVEPLVTLTTLSPRCIDSSIPILFDPRADGATDRAHACHRALFDRGCERGFVPYRVGIDQMDWVVDNTSPAWQLVERFKSAIDPDHLVAPGRYCPTV